MRLVVGDHLGLLISKMAEHPPSNEDREDSPKIIGAPARNTRKLTADRDPWSHNGLSLLFLPCCRAGSPSNTSLWIAWDDIEWTEEQLNDAENAISRQKENPVPEARQAEYNASPAEYWNKTYSQAGSISSIQIYLRLMNWNRAKTECTWIGLGFALFISFHSAVRFD